ncbi:ATP-binding protein [Pseudoramibacter porci]|uniref:AAA family ATPase n=1 Tax=Pseudoramibacter porci TaxID=2606631 RepID=A0A7X2NER6_9FIRM|nr:AAA family ATPase [Pseudoramibacter porci]MSS19086.1 AAA family ATPase [Pseudoramibacter porci]
MKIKTLHLIAFGKFKQTTIELDDGFNLIYGPNEAGKSTIQAFIEGMFFGFYKPYRKRRTYSEAFEQYKPLYSEQYRGAMIYVDEMGREIRIERDFLKERDGVRLFDNITGEDITETFPYDNITKQYMPLGYQSINASIYNNTVNFRQMASKTNADLAREINDKLIDMANNDTDISVHRVIDYLDEKKKAIGTFRATKSNYGMAVRNRSELEDKLEISEEKYQKIRLNQRKIMDYREEIKRLTQEQADIAAAEERQKVQAIEAQKEKLDRIKAEGEALEKTLAAYQADAEKYNITTYNHLQMLEDDRSQLNRQISRYEQQIRDIEEKIENTQKKSERLHAKVRHYNALQVEKDREDLKRIQSQYSRTEKKFERQRGGLSIFDRHPISTAVSVVDSLVGVFVLLLSLINPGHFLPSAAVIGLAVVGGVLALFFGLSFYAAHRRSTRLSETAASFDPQDRIATHLSILMERYREPRDLDALRMQMDSILDAFDRVTAADQELSNLSLQKQSLEEQIESYSDKIDKDQQAINDVLNPLGISKLEDYRQGLDNERKALDIQAKITANRQLYNDLEGENYIRVSKESDLFQEAKQRKRTVKRSIASAQREVARLEGENQTLADEVDSPVALREKIDGINGQIAAYEEEIRACDMAESFFMRYQKETHRSQAGSLNERIGDILKKITNKYREVRIDDKLNIKVMDPQNSNLIDLNQLSGGTIDQIYFALRFGLRDIVDEQRTLPFILDDPFVQYDDKRRKEGILFLSRVAKDDQVILLTCSQNEKQILDQDDIPYTGISL